MCKESIGKSLIYLEWALEQKYQLLNLSAVT